MTGHQVHVWAPTGTCADAVASCDCGWEDEAPSRGIARDLGDQHLRGVA